MTDRDSPDDKVTVEAAVEKAKAKFITDVDFADAEGELHTMVLTINTDFEGEAEAIVTVKATDDHDQVVRKRVP